MSQKDLVKTTPYNDYREPITIFQCLHQGSGIRADLQKLAHHALSGSFSGTRKWPFTEPPNTPVLVVVPKISPRKESLCCSVNADIPEKVYQGVEFDVLPNSNKLYVVRVKDGLEEALEKMKRVRRVLQRQAYSPGEAEHKELLELMIYAFERARHAAGTGKGDDPESQEQSKESGEPGKQEP